ncbi:MAG: response regulator, partial [bacterium]|nr:response regulator [bacterium]
MKNLLIIDDNEGYRSSVKSLLTREGYSVDDAPDGISGLEKFREVNHDLVLTDLIMENIDGLKVVEEIKKINSTTEVILITAYGTVETAVKAIKAGAYDYVTKESKIDEVILAIERAMEKKKLADKVILFENELKSKYKFEEIIGNSTQM